MTAGDAGPRPVTDVDTQLRDAIASVYKVRWIFLFAGAMLLVGAVAYLGSLAFSQQAQISAAQKLARNQQQQIRSQQAQLQSSCSFFQPLTGLPVSTPAPGRPATKLGVQIIAGARDTYHGQHCGPLPPPAASLVTWASYWHIPVAR